MSRIPEILASAREQLSLDDHPSIPTAAVAPRRRGRRQPGPTVMAIVLAGGEGQRLRPLTDHRAKPAVPFGGTLRLIDFVLSNFANAGFGNVVVLTEYRHDTIERHLTRFWGDIASTIVADRQPELSPKRHVPSGTAAAVHGLLPLIEDTGPDLVCVFGADHVYRMDPRSMLFEHVGSGAGSTVSVTRVPRDNAQGFGVIEAGPTGTVTQFVEKSACPPSLPGESSSCFASMGNYVFDRQLLAEVLDRDISDPRSRHDFGADILPALARRGLLRYFDFDRSEIARGVGPDVAYWRDVGTLDSYHAAHMDLLGPSPRFRLDDETWPTRAHNRNLPRATTLDLSDKRTGLLIDSLVCTSSVVAGARAVRAVIGPGCRLEPEAHIEDAVVLDGVRIGAGAVVRRAVIDNDVVIPPGERIGVDHEADASRFKVSPGGVVVVTRHDRFDTARSGHDRSRRRSRV